eukprot:CAMPEP_0170201102 /NCGR_PEP_ID=MMETSP0040_2-20121228/70209_1 /TAXON_ID=641309 /ORGANISM="Lotharella oceanica, Strain CCMP622" /LENGTH=83 /DNA_ID=CAMNT_0010451301 /DNA_START=1473 /DNA_END=1721 /DNA_ORIENTATION=+
MAEVDFSLVLSFVADSEFVDAELNRAACADTLLARERRAAGVRKMFFATVVKLMGIERGLTFGQENRPRREAVSAGRRTAPST